MHLTLPGLVAERLQSPYPARRIVVAVSGGPDSVALLRAVLSSSRLDTIVIAHVNHSLRGAESDADEDFVRRLHARFQVEHADRLHFECERIDTASQARTERVNLEALARRLRYRFLVQVAQKHCCSCIVTGHTANDQAETVLHRLIRGTGWRGLRGILPRTRLNPALELRRPLLSIRRSEVLAYLEAIGQDFRSDSSNADLRFLRNRIRRELLPLLEQRYNPAIVSILTHVAEQAQHQYRLLRQQARRAVKNSELPRAGATLVLNVTKLGRVPELVGCEALRLIWRREGWPIDRVGYRSWRRVWDVVMGRTSAVDLPGGVQVRRRGNVLQVQPRTPT
ncbi:MAG: tRNA lysidine(34) synthetase TilS [Gemmataceae bacterium]|nr:tRNA lysidine(34) synthetase TilS [Gemmataceae bacterium]